jgi:hypothetical protein
VSKPFRLKPPEPKEADVLRAVLSALAMHPRVAWAHRMQTGAGKLLRKGGSTSQFLRFGFPGCPDVLGQLRDGRILAVETKRPSGQPTPEQTAFLACVQANGGLALVARSVDDVLEALK